MDDPEPPHSRAAEPGEVVAELLPRGGILTDDVERRSNLALQIGMEPPDELLETR